MAQHRADGPGVEDRIDSKIDSKEAWAVTIAALIIMSVALGAPYVVIVALKSVAADLGGYRSIPSAAASLAMLGTGVGGLGMGWLAERIGVKCVVTFGALMVCAGLALSSAEKPGSSTLGTGS